MHASAYKWIEAGYELMAAEGPEAIQVERLARNLNLNKSGFYHHFGAPDSFLSILMEYHLEQNKKFNSEIALARNFDPEFINAAIRNKIAVMMQMQLRKHYDNQIFQEAFSKASRENEKYIAPLWADFLKIQGSNAFAFELYDLFRDVLFIRITSPDKFEEEIQNVTSIFLRLFSTLRRHGYILSTTSDKV